MKLPSFSKKFFRLYPFFGLALVLLLSSCASYHLRQGNRLFNSMAYNKAIGEYEKALKKKTFPAAKIGLAESYRLVNNTAKAEDAYANVVQISSTPIYKLRYAQLLMRNGKYPAAKTWLENYLKDSVNDVSAQELLASCDSIDAMKKDSLRATVELSKINTGQSNFSPVAYKDGIVFVSDRSSGGLGKRTYEWTGQPFLDMYYVKADKDGQLSIPEKLKGDANGIYHDGPVAFGNDSTMYLTRNNYVKRKFNESADEVVNLKIYKSTKKDSAWTNLQEMPFNSNEYSTGHPTLTKDGNTMYFTSDMPGGYGGTDLWMTKKEGETWSKPVNLGNKINTPFNEMFPTVYHDTVLYFSSQGHLNMGGLDIFSSKRDGDQLSDPVNMGYPINSSHDDFGLLMNEDGKTGYLSSDRANTVQDNIYSFKMRELRFTVDGIVTEKNTKEPIEGVTVRLVNKLNGLTDSVLTGPDGVFFFKLDPESDYIVMGTKDEYFTNSTDTTTRGLTESTDIHLNLSIELERIIINKPIVLENIYYDLDKWYIRPDAMPSLDKLTTVMKENPGIRIELSSHTDSRAGDLYNLILSQKRAQSAVDYIISRGVAKDRITAKGYGETRPVNRCKNGVDCTEEEHQANRRTEFRVTSIEKKTNL